MQKKIKKDKKQRFLFKEFEKKKLINKIITNNFNLNYKIRLKNQQKFFFFKKNISSITQIKNRCILTGRSKSIFRFFKLSRLQLKKYGSYGLLPGFSKYNW